MLLGVLLVLLLPPGAMVDATILLVLASTLATLTLTLPFQGAREGALAHTLTEAAPPARGLLPGVERGETESKRASE